MFIYYCYCMGDNSVCILSHSYVQYVLMIRKLLLIITLDSKIGQLVIS